MQYNTTAAANYVQYSFIRQSFSEQF